MVVDEPDRIVSDDDIAAVGYVSARLIVDALFVDKRIFGPYHRAVLMPFVVHHKIEVRIGVLGLQGLFDIRQGKEMGIFIHIHFLKAHDIRILGQDELQHFVLRRLVRVIHPACIPSQNRDCYEDSMQHSVISNQNSVSGNECDERNDHLFERYAAMLEGIAVVLCVVIELVRVGEEVRTGTEGIGAADVGARQAYTLRLVDREDILGRAVECFSYFIADVGVGILVRDDLYGILDARGTMVGGKHERETEFGRTA